MINMEFRCWHKEAREMFYPERQSDCFRWKEDGQPMEIMQFTGAEDFFGTKIFEGDIVFIDSRMIVGQIVMDVFAWRIKYGNDEVEWLCDYFEDIQVIGNIHEHPALLEQ